MKKIHTHSDASREKCKSPERNLAQELSDRVGLNPAQISVVLDLFNSYLENYCSDRRPPGVIVYAAVSADEPAGKPIKHCKLVPVKLTFFDEADVELQRQESTVAVRAQRLYRLCVEAQQQGGLLSYEDLSVLLTIDISTVKALVKSLRRKELMVPTRGAIKDMGPVPTHKKIIANMLGKGFTTTEIRSATAHSESSIGRYQHQFGLVLFLLHTYPEATRQQLYRLSDLSPLAFDTYADVAQELLKREDCRYNLERIQRRFEMDPQGLAYKIPVGKKPLADAAQHLKEQSLTTALEQAVARDLKTSDRVAEAVVHDIMNIVDDVFVLPEALRPGEAIIFTDAQIPIYPLNQPPKDRPIIPVMAPLYTEHVKELWRQQAPLGRRRAQVAAHIATAVHEQGGIMSIAGLAELLHVSPPSLAKDLRELAVALHVEAPTKGLIEDAGPTLTHKNWIIGLDHYGLTGEEISWITRHAPQSRDRYIKTYRRVETLIDVEKKIPDPELVSRVLSLRPSVAKQYVDLLQHFHGDGETIKENAATSQPAKRKRPIGRKSYACGQEETHSTPPPVDRSTEKPRGRIISFFHAVIDEFSRIGDRLKGEHVAPQVLASERQG